MANAPTKPRIGDRVPLCKVRKGQYIKFDGNDTVYLVFHSLAKHPKGQMDRVGNLRYQNSSGEFNQVAYVGRDPSAEDGNVLVTVVKKPKKGETR